MQSLYTSSDIAPDRTSHPFPVLPVVRYSPSRPHRCPVGRVALPFEPREVLRPDTLVHGLGGRRVPRATFRNCAPGGALRWSGVGTPCRAARLLHHPSIRHSIPRPRSAPLRALTISRSRRSLLLAVVVNAVSTPIIVTLSASARTRLGVVPVVHLPGSGAWFRLIATTSPSNTPAPAIVLFPTRCVPLRCTIADRYCGGVPRSVVRCR